MISALISRRIGLAALTSISAVFGARLAHARPANRLEVPEGGRVIDSLVITSSAPTRVTMRNVDFRIGDGVVLRIAMLTGEMRSLKRGVVDFDDKKSYVLDVDSAEVALAAADLTNLMNRYVFAYRGAPLKHLEVTQRGDQLGMKGTLRKGVDIPFDLTSAVTLMPDGHLRLHPTKIRIFGVNGKTLMSALGINLAKMLDLSKARGVTVQGNDLLLDPLVVLPPPAIHGHIAAVRVDRGGLVQTFSGSVRKGSLLVPSDSQIRNYMLYRGGTLHFGKLYMTDADLLIVDDDAADPFDFDNDHYQRQLIAGHSRTLPSLGLEVVMPDAGKVAR